MLYICKIFHTQNFFWLIHVFEFRIIISYCLELQNSVASHIFQLMLNHVMYSLNWVQCVDNIFSNCKFWCTWFILPVLFTVMKILDSVPENLCGLEVDSLVLPILQILSLPSADADTGSPNPAVSLSAKILKIIEKKLEKPGLMKAQVRLLLKMLLSYECYNV